jgi:hypothetical protein
MEKSDSIPDPQIHSEFKQIAEKSIGSSISLPALHKKNKNSFAEEKFKVSVDKKVTALYLKLFENRVAKLKKEEKLEKLKQEQQERIKMIKNQIFQRKIQDQEENKKFKEYKSQEVDKIKEQISKINLEHRDAMTDIKKHSSEYRNDLNKKRRQEKILHLKIKSATIETARQENYKKAEKIRNQIKNLETERNESKATFKSNLRKQYLAKIEQDRLEKQEYEAKLKSLESQEMELLQKLGKSHSTSIQAD